MASVPSGMFLVCRCHYCQQTENLDVLKDENVGLVGFCVLVNIATFWVHYSSSCCSYPQNTEVELGFVGVWLIAG